MRSRQLSPRKANPAKAGGLSLSPSAYVGDYEHKAWGTIKIRHTDGKLGGTQGILTLGFETTGKDEFLMHYGTGDPDKGSFEIGAGRIAAAVVMTLYDKPYRFARR